MTFTSILAFIVIVIFVLTVYLIIQGVKTKNWKKVIIPTIVFIIFIGLLFLGLTLFVTSM